MFKGKQYQPLRLPQGWCNSLILAHQQVREALELQPQVQSYVDDILIWSHTPEECADISHRVLEALGAAGFRVDPKKVQSVQSSIRYLGMQLDTQGLGILEQTKEALAQLPSPHFQKELQSQLGLMGWCRAAVPDFAALAHLLYQALMNKSEQWEWGEEEEGYHQEMLQAIVESPPLLPPDLSTPKYLEAGVRGDTISAVLYQQSREGGKNGNC